MAAEVVLRDRRGWPVLEVSDDGLSVNVIPQAGVRYGTRARLTGQITAIASLLAVNVGGNDGTFEVSANVLVTTATTHAFTVTVAYTDEGGTARTLTLTFGLVAGGVAVTSIANGNGAVPYHGAQVVLRAKAGTTITVATTGTFTTVTYNIDAQITQRAAA